MEQALKQTKKILAGYIKDQTQLEVLMQIIETDMLMAFAKGKLEGTTQFFNSIHKPK